MGKEEEPKPRDISTFSIPIVRIALSVFLLINLINNFIELVTGQFNLSKSISFISILMNGILIIFYLIELRKEQQNSYIKAIYFRIATLIIEFVLMLRFSFSIVMLCIIDIQSFETWVLISQDMFLVILLFILFRQNLIRTRLLFH